MATTRPIRSRQIAIIGSRIRQLRRAANMTQRQLASGRYTGAYISALEKGLVRPSAAAMEHIAKRLNVKMADLLVEEQEELPLRDRHVPANPSYCAKCLRLWPCADYIAEQLAVVATLGKLGSMKLEKGQ
jgi:transcriptional regulator with XRE-family HTH domain